MYNQGWKCPNCGKAHGPHVNTCPGITTPSTIPGTTPYPPNKLPDKWVPTTHITKDTCSKCGLELSAVMGYVCSRVNCPAGLGPATSYISTSKFDK